MLFSPNRGQFESILSLFARILETLNVLICIFLWHILRPLFWVTLNELSGVTSYNRHVGFHIKMQISRGSVKRFLMFAKIILKQQYLSISISQICEELKSFVSSEIMGKTDSVSVFTSLLPPNSDHVMIHLGRYNCPVCILPLNQFLVTVWTIATSRMNHHVYELGGNKYVITLIETVYWFGLLFIWKKKWPDPG